MLNSVDGRDGHESAFRPYQLNMKSDQKVIKNTISLTSQPNDHTIEKLLNSPSTSSSTASPPARVNQLSSSMVLSQFAKSQLPLDLIAQTLWLQHQHFQQKFNSNGNNITLFNSGNSSLLQSTSSPIREFFSFTYIMNITFNAILLLTAHVRKLFVRLHTTDSCLHLNPI